MQLHKLDKTHQKLRTPIIITVELSRGEGEEGEGALASNKDFPGVAPVAWKLLLI